MTSAETTTADSLLGGAVSFRQPAAGYRVNVDSVLLADFAAQGRRAELALDLGAGVGVLSLLLDALGAAARFALVERDAELARHASQNLAASGATGRVFVADLEASGLPAELRQAADLVIVNPPFFRADRERPAADARTRSARTGALEPFLAAAAAALAGSKARAAIVYPARSLPELFAAALEHALVPKRLRLVHSFAERPARVALLELRRARPGGLVVEPPFVEWRAPGTPTAELAALSAGRASDRR